MIDAAEVLENSIIGLSFARAIGERLGKSPQNVRITTNTIKSADLYESGEADAEAGYWA